PFLRHKLAGEKDDMRIVACEPASCPTLTKGPYLYDFGDSVGLTPLLAMYTLGHNFVPAKIHAGGLRYHGSAPLASHVLKLGQIEAAAFNQIECFEAGVTFARAEGWVPAPETNHVIRGTILEALKCKESGEEKVIAFNASGHGHFDMGSYQAYFSGELEEHYFTDEMLQESLKKMGDMPKP
ncbi:MAG: TrpB-like pyridoxal-phosphate dependent enzyme, partial [Candidatus Latescibacterota bacterium]